jgi:putative ABC transport system substrate-binding protein
MKRRGLMLLLGGAAVLLPLTARGQQRAMPVVGWLNATSPPLNPGALLQDPIHQGLRQTGYIEGQNLAAEYRWADASYDRLPALAADLILRKVDVIIAAGAPSALAAKKSNIDDPDRLYWRERSGWVQPCCQSRPSRR